MPENHDALNAQHARGSALTFAPGYGKLTRAVINTPTCRGEIYLHGAHVTRWKPADHDDVLWMSEQAVFNPNKPIRGGIPICFPWFGNNKPADEPDAPAHGYARIQAWDVLETHHTDEQVQIALTTTVGNYHLTYRVGFGSELDLELNVTNQGDAPAEFEEALHTYFTVSQIKQVQITGLSGAEYLHTVAGANTLHTQDEAPITFTAETDRVYRSAGNVVLHDPGLQRRIEIEKHFSNSTVVWNPWIDKSKAMSDFGNDEWLGMVCVESGNIAPHAVRLEPGATHTMRTKLNVATPQMTETAKDLEWPD